MCVCVCVCAYACAYVCAHMTCVCVALSLSVRVCHMMVAPLHFRRRMCPFTMVCSPTIECVLLRRMCPFTRVCCLVVKRSSVRSILQERNKKGTETAVACSACYNIHQQKCICNIQECTLYKTNKQKFIYVCMYIHTYIHM